MNWLGFVLRWFHLVAAITAVGGSIFMRFALAPSVSVLADEQRKMLHEQVRSRWAKLVMASIGFLLLTGLVNVFLFLSNSITPEWEEWHKSYSVLYNAVFGLKFLLAMFIFFVASALAGRGEATKSFRQNAQWWMTVNVALSANRRRPLGHLTADAHRAKSVTNGESTVSYLTRGASTGTGAAAVLTGAGEARYTPISARPFAPLPTMG